jgi:hypothetical protein
MSQATPSWDQGHMAALENVWGEYRTWAATARQQRAEIASWRFRVLLLTILGAGLGTLSQYLPTFSSVDTSAWLSPAGITGILSAMVIAFATYFSREILSPDRERRWIRARSVAEALKAEAYLFRTAVPPYDRAAAAVQLLERAKEIFTTAKDVEVVSLTPEQRREQLPQGSLTVPGYIAERVDEQINNFYRPRASEYQARITRLRTVILMLGVIAAILGAIGASGWTAAWVAVITTMIATLTAYIAAERYQYLIVSYQATARQLEMLKTSWLAQGQPEADVAKRHEFLRDCEAAISIENQSWMARWSEETPSLIQPKKDVDENPAG